jgi:nicotinate phosphoribosyltransferase
MMAGYFEAGKASERATFELFVRRLPPHRNFLLAAGLAQAIEYLLDLRFTAEEIAWCRALPQFERVNPEFFDALAALRFSGDVWAVPEGTPLFPDEPLLTVRAPLMEAQLVETYLLATIGFQSVIATKAARMVAAAQGRSVMEFGTRRAHSAQAGVLGARAAYIGGCIGTSNVETGMRFGVPVFGTAAHSWITAFSSERDAFEQLQKLLGPHTVQLIDTYDTLGGARIAAALGKPLWGVRLDSGNLGELARGVRRILDEAGLEDARIIASGDLNEHKIAALAASDAPIDVFGVGTDLATSADAPSSEAVYKMVEMESEGGHRFTYKLSEDKATLPGRKQIFRYAADDVLALSDERPPGTPEALIRPVLREGRLLDPLPTAAQAREHASKSIAALPAECNSLSQTDAWRVALSSKLEQLRVQMRHAGGSR